MGCGTNTVFLGGVEHCGFLSRITALFWNNALAEMYGGNQDVCYY